MTWRPEVEGLRGRLESYSDSDDETAAGMETTPLTESSDWTARRSSRTRRRWLGLGAFIAFTAILGGGIWYTLTTDSKDRGASSGGEQGDTDVVALSPKGLQTLAMALGQPIYWLGTQPDTTYEVSQAPNGRVYVRYLPDGTEVGDSGTFLTVGTYVVRKAFEVVDSGTREPGASAIDVGGGGVGLVRTGEPSKVYVAYPGSNYQIEVSSPTPNEARRLVESGRLQALGGAPSPGTTSGAAEVSEGRLEALARSLGRPIYWAGTRPNTTYEFTRAGEGVHVRYLPAGVPVGTSQAYLTVSTYPVQGAFGVTEAAAAQPGAVKFAVGGGGIALYSAEKPTNVYVAYPGSDYQVEVYHPKPGEARKLVAAESIAPVR